MKQEQTTLNIACRGRGMYDITRDVTGWVRNLDIQTGMLNLFVQHTSCSLLIQENADPSVQHDMERFLEKLVVDGDPMFRHRAEGPDDMSAHIRMALTQVSLSIPVSKGMPALGIWQGIYLYEHRTSALQRRVALHLIGS